MPTLEMRREKYDANGRCVFCTKTFDLADMTDEHIIPDAILGKLVIKNGACEECARRGNAAYENDAINNDFELPRLLLHLRGKGTWKPPKDIRHLPPVYAGDVTQGGEGPRLNFAPEHYPKMFSLYGFPPPGLLAGADRGSALPEGRLFFFKVAGQSVANVTVAEKRTSGAFGLTLAKIAYCFAIAEKRFDYTVFDGDPIRALLRGERDDIYNFVGGADPSERLGRHHLHALYFREKAGWLTVLVHLFASCATGPETCAYEVVVGKLNGR